MTDLHKIRSVFCTMLEKETHEEKEAYLGQICRDDPELRTEIDALLRAQSDADNFFKDPLIHIEIPEYNISEVPGDIVGRYKLLEQIGEGGMAVVYMAEQKEPIRRKVALKIIKLGMDTKSVIARFEAERQALAMMDHPNIAKVLDAGATETGRLYFVMELVKGASITDFCDANNLSTHERLKLFVLVCQAVQHAHQKGIIHRDIKPSNVMVTLHDGVPVPKVIDFGIAKAVNRQLTEKTLFTRYAQIIGTPAYMSPEQAEMSGLDIDIRTDVYSLGTLLYELLTGSPPFESEYLLSKSYEEMQRIIREEEPTRPSTKINTLGQARIDIAKYRNTSPQILHKLIRDDLDWIVMKTLEKNRDRRYDSVGEFTVDIARYLNNEPVLAGPPSTMYRIRKFIKRHRVLVTASTAIAISIIIGMVVSTSLYLKMRRALNTVVQLETKVEIDSKLSTAQRLYAEGRYQPALNEIEATLDAQNPHPETQLLKAQLLVEMGRQEEAETQLLNLTNAEPEIAGAAYYLMAQINMGINDTKAHEYEALAASMLPETAEARYLRARTAMSPSKALQWLDQAIAFDPSHYPSRKARVLIYYSRCEDVKMAKDVEALIALRPADSLGYALRAVLHRESGQFEQALADHMRAIKLCESQTERSILNHQRYETYVRTGDYTSALQDARRSAELEPNEFGHQLNLFKMLFALGDFTTAQQQYRSIVKTSHQWHRRFNRELSNHVFDILADGGTLSLPPTIMYKAPFAQMLRAADCYHALTSKATLLPTQRQGLVPCGWSPDSKKLLCGWMSLYGATARLVRETVPIMTRTQGLKIIDIESGEEHHIETFLVGKPAWSPDGKFIAYPDRDDNLTIVPVEGGQAQKVASGYWPHWSEDSQRLYYNTKWNWGELCSINVHDPDPIPEKLMRCMGNFIICKKENWIALGNATSINIVDFSSGDIIDQYPYPWPQTGWRFRLSPDHRELCFTPWYRYLHNESHIIDMYQKKLYRVLDVPADRFVWSPDGSRLAIGARNRIWIMELDPHHTVSQFLGERIPDNDLIGRHIEERTQAIEADPLYPENYLQRAVAYMSLDRYDKAQSDLEQFDALVTSDDHHVHYEIFWWLRQYYYSQLYKQAECLAPYTDKLMDRFPSILSSSRGHITRIIEINESNGEMELAERWRTKLQDLDGR